MQQALRPYATAGIALVGASMIAITPVVPPPPGVQVRPVRLVDAWSDLLTDTTANLQNIVNGADSSAISQVFSELLTNPLGVIGAFANITPTVATDLTSLPATISVELPPGLELGIAGLGATGATFTAIENVVQQLQSDPSLTTLYEGVATILNGYLNGEDNISLLGGTITIPFYNGVLAPEQSLDVNLNLTNLIDALGLGNLNLSNLDLSSLLNQLGLGDLTLGSLFSDLGLSGDGLGTLLGDPTLGTLLSDLGLGGLGTDGLGLGSFSLTTLLTDLGLNSDVGGVGLSSLLNELGLGNLDVATLLSNVTGVSLPLITAALTTLGIGNVSLADLLGGLTLGSGNPLSLTTLVTDLFNALGVSVPSTGPLSLASLLGDLNIDNLSVGSLLNNVTLGDLLNDLGLSSLPLNLSDLGNLSGLTLDGLLGDLGLGDLANVSVEPLGGFDTLLVDIVPQQILTALGM
jgi:hypothetical protein